MFDYIVIHHTVSPLGSGRQIAAEKKYHLIIDKVDGKYQFIQSVLDNSTPAATGCFNSRAYAIAVVGNYDVSPVPDDLLNFLCQAILIKSRILARKQILTYHAYVGRNLAACSYGTACPGRHLIARLPELKQMLVARGGLQ